MVDEDRPIDEDIIRGANGKPLYANNGGKGNTPTANTANNVDTNNKTANTATTNTGTPQGYSESHVFEETFRKANPNPELSPEEKKAKEKQERNEKLENFFGKVGNLVSGLSNLYFTTKGAPSAYQKQADDDTKQLNDRWEKYWLNEEAKKKAWARDLGTAVAKDVDNNNKQRQWWATMEEKKKESKRKELIANAQIGRLQAMQEGDKAKAKYWEARERALADGLSLDAAEAQAKAEYYRALGRKANTEADKVRNEIGDGAGNRYYGTYGGKRYATKADYDKAVLEDAKRRGVNIRQTVGGIEVDGKVYDAKEVDRAIADIAGEMSYQDSQRQTQAQGGSSTKQPAKPQRNTNSGAAQQPSQNRVDNNVLKGFSIHK